MNLIINRKDRTFHLTPMQHHSEDEIIIKDYDVTNIDLSNIEIYKVNENLDGLVKDTSIELTKNQESKLKVFREKYLLDSTKPVEYETHFYKGGELSASAISGAILLSQSLGESDTEIVDNSDKKHTLSFTQAQELTQKIAKAWRTSFFKYKDLKVKVSEAATVEELNLIVWEN